MDLQRTIALMVAFFLLTLAVAWWAVADEGSQSTADAILAFDVGVDSRRAYRIGEIIDEAADMHDLDPLLIAALIRRESAYWASVESRRLFGKRGEIGLMQTHGVALSHRPEDCSRRLEGAYCQVQTGAAFLGYVRERCPGSTWRWVAAYGMSRCPSEESARHDVATQRARAYYQDIGGTDWN